MKVASIVFLSLLSFVFLVLNTNVSQKLRAKIYNRYIYTKYSIIDIYWFFQDEVKYKKKCKNDEKNTKRFIAHAGGKIDQYIYTDSLEALNENYKKGFRLFELDIIKTKDDIFVAAHDWKSWRNKTEYKRNIPPTLSEFKKYKIYNKYTPMDITDINQWFLEHPDAVLVTDKVNTPKEFSKKFFDKKRLIMELFDWYAVDEALKLNIQPMPNWKIVKKLKRNIPKKLLDLNISYIALSRRDILTNKSLLKELKYNCIKTYVYHINFEKEKDEKYVFCNEMDYIYGLYADKWEFKEVDCKN